MLCWFEFSRGGIRRACDHKLTLPGLNFGQEKLQELPDYKKCVSAEVDRKVRYTRFFVLAMLKCCLAKLKFTENWPYPT